MKHRFAIKRVFRAALVMAPLVLSSEAFAQVCTDTPPDDCCFGPYDNTRTMCYWPSPYGSIAVPTSATSHTG